MRKNRVASWANIYWMFALLCLVAGAFSSASVTAAEAASLPASNRLKINLGATPWRYNLTDDQPDNFIKPEFDDSQWPTTGIPHSPNESNMFTNWESGGGAGFMLGRVWYRKHLNIDKTYIGRKVIVEFEGSHTGVQVYINGQFIKGASDLNPQATHVIGFLPFVVDLTPYLKFDGTDVLAVKTAANGDFFANPDFAGGYRFGQGDTGLFRPVYMYITDPVHIPQNVYPTLKTWGTYVATRSANSDSAAIHVETNIVNESQAAKNVTLTTQILDKDGTIVAHSELTKTLAPNAGPGLQVNKYEQELTVDHPTLWYPNNVADHGPYMYRVFHIVSIDGAVIDATESPLGIRIITWNNDTPIINGLPVKFWGASGRYDYPALGTAVPEEQQWRDLQLLAAAGGNVYRAGHSSPSQEFVAAADALGVMLMQPSGDGEDGFDQNCYPGDADSCPDNVRYKHALKTELHREMVYRDRNNPSILAWEANNGIMNPTLAQNLKDISNGLEQVPALNDLPAVLARPQSSRDGKHPQNGDFLSCTRQSCEINLKRDNPTMPTWNAESWGDGGFRGGYDYEIKFVAEYLKDWSEGVSAGAFGLAQWYLADTPGETGTHADGSDPKSVRGIADSMLDQNRLPKLMYYAYQASWTPFEVKPVIALANSWNRSGLVRVNVFSNCPAVRLKVNGEQQGDILVPNPIDSKVTDISQDTTQLPFQAHWDGVQWQAGTVTAECLPNVDKFAQPVAIDQRTTAGQPDHLELIAEPGLQRPDGSRFQITANGSDAAFITARVLDANGIVVPTATNNITFAVSDLGNYRGGTQQRVTSADELARIGFLTASQAAEIDDETSTSPTREASIRKMISYHSPDSPELAAEAGLQRIAVRSRFQDGQVTVSATSPGLGSAQTTFQIVPVPLDATQDAAPPVVVVQPAGQLVSAGEQATFSVTASGAGPLSFKWYRDNVEIVGATGSSYVTPVTTVNDNGGAYKVYVSNGVGNVYSQAATLQVVPPVPASIVTGPVAVTLPVGQVAKFTVQAAGSPTLKYKWFRNNEEIAGAQQDSYTTAPVTLDDDGALYSVSVGNALLTVNSSQVRMTVLAAIKPVFTVQPASKVAQLGQSVTFSATATGSAPMHFVWKNGPTVVATADVNTEGSGSTTLKIDSVKTSDLGNYTVEVSNAANAPNETVASNVATLTQAPPGENLALNKHVDASSFQDPQGMPASALTDGNTLTRWGSDQKDGDNANVLIDLATPETFNHILLRWEAAYATEYKIEVSNDKDDPTSWKEIHHPTQATGGLDEFTFDPVSARYVRLTGLKRASDYGYSLYEIEIYNVPGCGPGQRYNVLDADNVIDNASGLTWQRRAYTLAEQGAQFTQPVAQAYCESKGMRLPTVEEASAISKYNTASCAFPGQWTTWTSQLVADQPDNAYTVGSDGLLGQSVAVNAPGSALCVSGSSQVQAPVFTLQPVNQTVAAGASAHFSAAASGSNVTYNWFRDGTLVSTSSQPGYDTPLAKAADNGSTYLVKARNVSGEASSQTVSLSVVGSVDNGGGNGDNGGGNQPPAPVITSAPASQTVALGDAAQFTVKASGNGTLGYQWYRDGQQLTGATSDTYTIAAVTLDDNGATFTVTVTTSAGGNASTQPATLLVQDGAPADDVNLALNQAVFTSAPVENDNFGKASNAVDGDPATRWASDLYNDTSWITIDLGTAQAVTKVELDWENAYGKRYLIQVSQDNQTYRTVYTQNTGRGGNEILSFPTETVRYVRMQGVERNTQYGYSLFEFKVFGPKLAIVDQPQTQTAVVGQVAHFAVKASIVDGASYQWFKGNQAVQVSTDPSYQTPALTMADSGALYSVVVTEGDHSASSNKALLTVLPNANARANLALNQPVTSSGAENDGFAVDRNAVDGNTDTRWSSNFDDTAWIAVDLGVPVPVSEVVLNWERAYGAKYLIQTSLDGQQWTQVAKQDDGKGGIEQVSFATTTARFVRMQGVQRSSQYGYSLYEFEVYGSSDVQAPPPPPPTPTLPAISGQPGNVSVLVGQTAHFAVSVTGGTAPFSYQWYKRGQLIDGAVSATYDTPAAVASDDGATFSVIVSVKGLTDTVKSQDATLTVNTGAGNGDYTIYPGFVGVDLQNNTGGAWRDDQVYIAVIARNPATGHFSYLKPDGTIVEAQLTDNDAPGHLSKNGQNYSNYFFTLAQSKTLKLPKLDSGRIFVSMGSPLFIKILADGNQQVGFAGPNVLNASDPNTDVYFDWYEFSYNDNGLWTNTTQVDQFGLSLLQDVYGSNRTFHQQTGITESRASLFDAYRKEMPAEYLAGEQSGLRIFAPAKTTFDEGQVNGHYFDAYVDQIWDYYRTTSLTVRIGGQKFVGRVNAGDDQFVFNEVDANTGAVIGTDTYIVARKPSTQEIFEGKGVLASGNDHEKQIEAQMCAAFNRHVAGDATNWAQPAAFYGAAPSNAYANFFHKHSVGGKAYGFAYDDVSDESSTIQAPQPEHMVLGIGW